MNGLKTYIAAFLGILVVGAQVTGLITDEQARLLEQFLTFVGLAALRHAAKPSEPKS